MHAAPSLGLLSSGMALHAISGLVVLKVLLRLILFDKLASSALVKSRVRGILLLLTRNDATILLLLLSFVQERWLLLIKEGSLLTTTPSGESISGVGTVIPGDGGGMSEARLAGVGCGAVQTHLTRFSCFVVGDASMRCCILVLLLSAHGLTSSSRHLILAGEALLLGVLGLHSAAHHV